MANMKSVAINSKFGPQSKSARNYIRSLDSSKWISNHKFVEIRNKKNEGMKEMDEYNRKTI